MASPIPIEYHKFIHRSEVQANPRNLYVFGDNVARIGRGGQAKAMRGEPNAHGIATLWEPGMYFTDKMYTSATRILTDDILALRDRARSGNYDRIIFPADGVGTGLAHMRESAPLVFFFMTELLKLVLGIQNGHPQTSSNDEQTELDAGGPEESPT